MSQSLPRSAVSPGHDSSALSRRRLLIAGLAGASAAAVPAAVDLDAVPGLPGPGAAAALPLVKPISSHAAYSAFGVCALPHLGDSPYRYTSQWMAALAQTGASYFRGLYAHKLSATAEATSAPRAHDIQWGMTVCPDLSFPDAELVARIKHIAANAADRCLFIAGINEPNHDRGTANPPRTGRNAPRPSSESSGRRSRASHVWPTSRSWVPSCRPRLAMRATTAPWAQPASRSSVGCHPAPPVLGTLTLPISAASGCWVRSPTLAE